MKKGLLILSFLLINAMVFAQDKALYIQSFVKQDTIQLRWAPSNADLFLQGLKEGYSLIRTPITSGEKKTFTIAPFNDRKEQLLQSTDTTVLFLTSFVAEYLNRTPSGSSDKQMPYFLLSLSASTSQDIAKICGLYYEDLTAGINTYRYEIKFLKDDNSIDQLEVNGKVLNENIPFSKLIGSSRIDLKEVYLEWEAKSLNAGYGGYWLLKSEDNVTFIKLNSTPIYYLTSQYEPDKSVIDYLDTAVTEGETYYYKTQPINHFGDYGKISNTVEVYIQKRLNGFCAIDTVRSTQYDRLISGSYRTEFKQDNVSEFILYRSTKVDSGFKQIDQIKNINNTFEFTYKANLLSGDRHYFKVIAVSVDKDSVTSYPYYHFSLDQEPPSIPENFSGIVSDKGIAKLNWTAPNDNDIRGYRIYRANGITDEMVEVTTHFATGLTYSDTLRLDNLTSEIYYRIRAVDMNYNNSPLSEFILLMKPDTIPPVASVIKSYKVKENGVYLEWENSRSEDLATQFLIRTSSNAKDTVLIFKNESNKLLDSTGTLGTSYEYAIHTFDKTGNRSFSQALHVAYEIGYRKSVSTLICEINRVDKKIDLNWEITGNEKIYSVQIYRAKNDGKFRLHKTIREDETLFSDVNISPNNVYHYKIKVVYQSGHSSKMSKKTTVTY